jgi:hypothetical protein
VSAALSQTSPLRPDPADRRHPAGQRANLRTALILLSVAAAFFAGIVIKHWLFGG